MGHYQMSSGDARPIRASVTLPKRAKRVVHTNAFGGANVVVSAVCQDIKNITELTI